MTLKRTIVSTFAAAALITLQAACDGGREGDRCNPNLSHVGCNDGLSCVMPSTCVESYCCPSDLTKSTSAYCNGSLCPQPTTTVLDAGSTDAPSE